MPALRHRTDIQLRFGDTDALGHVNNAAYAAYAELGRLDFLHALHRPVESLILAHLAIDYRRPVEYGERVHVETYVERIGRTSVTLRQEVCAAGQLAADVRSVVVVYDYATRQPVAIPSAAREALAPYLEG